MVSLGSLEPTTALITNYSTGGSFLYLRKLTDAFQRKMFPLVTYLPGSAKSCMSDAPWCRFILKEPATCPSFLRPKFIKYMYHLSKYIYNVVAFDPSRHTRVAHLLFPFYLTDWMTIMRLKQKGIRVVVTIHEVFPHKPFLGGKMDRLLIKKMCDGADVLTVHTDSLKNMLTEFYAIDSEKILVVPHGYFEYPEASVEKELLKEKYHIPLDKRILLFFGTIRGNKGLDVLLGTVNNLYDHFFLVVAGTSALASEPSNKIYEKIIRKYNLNSKLLWIDRVILDREIPDLFKAADAVILPYKNTFHAQSGILNLAIGYEKPLVVTNVGGVGEIVRKYNLGIVVEPENSSALKNGIIQLFESQHNPYGFKRYKEENSWDRIAVEYIRIYEGLLYS
jgi:glycosyltransferase involved in cell wall biosynthesis